MTAAIPILYACGAALLIALRPNFAKLGGKKSAPSLSAALYATVVFAVYLASAILGDTIRDVFSVDNLTLLKLLGAAMLRALIWLCLFAALSTGTVNRVMPLYLLTDVLLTVISLITQKTRPGIWQLCCILLVLLGAVMTESRSRRGKSVKWFLFGLTALLCNVGINLYYTYVLKDVAQGPIRVGETGLAAVLLWILSASGKAFNSFRKMEADSWLFLILTGLSAAVAVFFETQTSGISDPTVLNPIRCAILPLTVLLARLIHKEKMPGSAVLGVALFTIGTFGLMLNL